MVAPKLGRTLLALGDLDGAIAAATPAWDLYEDGSGGCAALLGEAWRKKGDSARATSYLEAAIRVSPFDPAPHCALADLYKARGGPGDDHHNHDHRDDRDHRDDQRSAREARACATLAE